MKEIIGLKNQKKIFVLISVFIIIMVSIIILNTIKEKQFMKMQSGLETIENAMIQYNSINNEYAVSEKIDELNGDLLETLEDIGDDGKQVYSIDNEKINQYLDTKKVNLDKYYYSIETDTAIYYEGKLDKNKHVNYILNENKNEMNDFSKTLVGVGNDELKCIEETADGGYIACGYTEGGGDFKDSKGKKDGLVIKYNINGNVEWIKMFGGNEDDELNSIHQTVDGGYIIGGNTNSYTDLKGNSNTKDSGLILKLDSNGNLEWDTLLGSSIKSVMQLQDESFIACGSIYVPDDLLESKIQSDGLISKINIKGDVEWNKNYGGPKGDCFLDIKETNDKGFIVCGESYGGGQFGNANGGTDALLLKVNDKGEIQWNKLYGGNKTDIFRSIDQKSMAGYIVCGYTNGGGDFTLAKGEEDALIASINENGEIEWSKVLGGSKNDELYSIKETNDKKYIACGYTKGGGDFDKNSMMTGTFNNVILELDETGNLKWQESKCSLFWNKLYSVYQCKDGGYIMCGYTTGGESVREDVIIKKIYRD